MSVAYTSQSGVSTNGTEQGVHFRFDGCQHFLGTIQKMNSQPASEREFHFASNTILVETPFGFIAFISQIETIASASTSISI